MRGGDGHRVPLRLNDRSGGRFRERPGVCLRPRSRNRRLLGSGRGSRLRNRLLRFGFRNRDARLFRLGGRFGNRDKRLLRRGHRFRLRLLRLHRRRRDRFVYPHAAERAKRLPFAQLRTAARTARRLLLYGCGRRRSRFVRPRTAERAKRLLFAQLRTAARTMRLVLHRRNRQRHLVRLEQRRGVHDIQAGRLLRQGSGEAGDRGVRQGGFPAQIIETPVSVPCRRALRGRLGALGRRCGPLQKCLCPRAMRASRELVRIVVVIHVTKHFFHSVSSPFIGVV